MPTACDILLHAAYIVTQDNDRTMLEDASLAVNGGRIAGLGPRAAMEMEWRPARTLDLGNALLLPGLINAHTHSAMTFLRGLADDLPLMEWLMRHIFPVEKHLTPEIVEWSALLGHAEMLRTGTTACIDMYLIEDAVFRAARTSGIRCAGGEAVFNFPGAGSPGPDQTLDMARRQASAYRDDSRISVLVCPHAVYTTTPAILERCRDVADELNAPLHLHLAENASETAQCLKQWGQRPIALCRRLGLLRGGTTLAHVVDVDDAELDVLAASGVVVAHNPSSNMKLASGVARAPEMLARGIPLALGSDGAASNNQLNMFVEMGRTALLHKVHGMDPTLMPAQAVLDMATHGGASAMGRRDLGRLAPGLPADLAALDLDAPNLRPMYNPTSHMVYAATGMETRFVMVEGEILYQDGAFTRFDYPALLAEMDGIRKWARKKL